MSGGGTSGKVEYPQHVTEVHKDWLGYAGSGAGDPITTNLIEVMDQKLGLGGNPYESVSYGDPTTDIEEFEDEITEFKTKVDGLNAETDFDSVVDNAVAKIDEAGILKDIDKDPIISAAQSDATDELSEAIKQAIANIDDSVIEDLVEEFSKRSDFQRARSVRRFSGQMSDINAVQSSAFIFGMALIESEHVKNVNEFNKEISAQHYQQHIQSHIELYKTRLSQDLEVELRSKLSRDQILANSVQLTLNMLSQNVSFKQALAQSLIESKRIKFVMDSEFTAQEADMDAKEEEWDLRVYEFGAAILGAPGGGTRMPEKPSKAGSAIGGALSGAVSGAPLGPSGMIAGAALGGLAGLLQ